MLQGRTRSGGHHGVVTRLRRFRAAFLLVGTTYQFYPRLEPEDSPYCLRGGATTFPQRRQAAE